MNYKEALQYIHSVSWRGSRPGLSRISDLCRAIGSPEKELQCIHVSGTNGKGSVSAELTEILCRSGYRTGLFTSPYVLEFRERIRIGREIISEDSLAEVTGFVKSAAQSMADAPTEFELITAIAFEYFRREKCDLVVLETGLGGRLDSTNIIEAPVLSIITGIALDHTDVLGTTAADIAREKSGIIKPSRPAVLGAAPEEARDVVRRRAAECASALTEADPKRITNSTVTLNGTDFSFASRGGRFDAGGNYRLSLLGEYQLSNVSVVLTAAEVLREEGISVPSEALHAGLASTVWPARLEVISRNPTVIYDGAHNPQGIAAAVQSLKTLFPGVRPIVLIGVMEDKDLDAMSDILCGYVLSAHAVCPDNPRAMPQHKLAEELCRHGIQAVPHKTVSDGVRAAMAEAEERSLPLAVLGSLYMYAEVLKTVKSINNAH